MKKNILITGGAGFIGSHLCDELIGKGYDVKVLDSLIEQVHGKERSRPEFLHPDVELIKGDVRDPEVVANALKNTDAVYHFAARVGVGQSMYEIQEYTSVNNMGTAILMESLVKNPVEKLLVASSMSIYGEGLYKTAEGKIHQDAERTLQQLKTGDWELKNKYKEPLFPIPTSETKFPSLASVYALSKYDQEKMCLICGRAYNIPTVALRFFNVYGPRQALSNPYTGVLAIFASRLLNNNSPLIFEDGMQKRDFVNVSDVATACRLALETKEAAYEVFNIGSGNSFSVMEIAEKLSSILGKDQLRLTTTGKYRIGDIRHCYADITKAKKILKYQPQVTLESGLEELSEWLQQQDAVDNVDYAKKELVSRGLLSSNEA
jgi:dTDP-L-rhamnose 4-epimerase